MCFVIESIRIRVDATRKFNLIEHKMKFNLIQLQKTHCRFRSLKKGWISVSIFFQIYVKETLIKIHVLKMLKILLFLYVAGKDISNHMS